MAGPSQQGQQVIWGTNSNTTYGLIQKMTTGKGASQKEYKDYQGDTKTLVTYDKHDTIQITALCTAAVELPEKGDQFTIDGKTYYCTDCSIEWSNEDAQQVSISGRTYPTIS